MINGKSSHFSVKCLTDFKSVKHFTEKKKIPVKYFSVSHFPKNIFLQIILGEPNGALVLKNENKLERHANTDK